MVAQPAPFGVRHIVRQASDQHVMSLAFQALGQRDHRVYIASGAEGSEQNFHAWQSMPLARAASTSIRVALSIARGRSQSACLCRNALGRSSPNRICSKIAYPWRACPIRLRVSSLSLVLDFSLWR